MTGPVPDEHAHRSGVERGLQRAFVALVALFGALWAGTVAGTPALGCAVFLAAVGCLLSVWVLTAVRGWRVRLGAPDALATTAVAVLVLLLMPPGGVAALPPGTLIQLVVIPAVLAAGYLPASGAVPVFVLLSVTYVFVSFPADGFAALAGLWPVGAASVAAAVVLRVMRRTAGAADTAYTDLIRVRVEGALAEGRHAAHREFRRLLHDHVSAALRALANGKAPPEETRSACRAGVTALATEPELPLDGSADLGLHLCELAGSTSTPLRLDVREGIVVPTVVARATVRAVAEVLRNVDRHAGATEAVLAAHAVPDGFVMTVSDDGTGCAGTDRPGAVGLRRSVVERMADVGGTAEVASVPGAGTTVELAWSSLSVPMLRPSRVHVLELAVEDVRRPLTAVCVPYLVGTAMIAAAQVGRAGHATLLVAWYAVVCGCVGLLLWRARHGLGRRGSAAWVAVVLTLVWSGLLLMPPDGLAGYASWPVGAVGPLLAVLAVLRPPWEALLACVLEMASIEVLVSFSVLNAAPLPQLLPALFAPMFGTLMGTVVATTMLHYGRLVAYARNERLAVETAQAHRAARAVEHRARVAEIGRELEPFLDAVARGDLDPASLPARVRAAELDQVARDELHLPGVLDPGTRATLATARAHGCAVAFHIDSDTVDIPRVAVSALRAVLTGNPPDEVTLSVFPRPDDLLVSIVAVPGDEDRCRRLVAELRHLSPSIDATEDATCVSVVL
ncbi:MAG TPA: ATP-binding protein [Pseudonocardiaceae bacterium]|nr:ATP-binding protein [Pseudonocardiaceae bacterium]